MLGNLIVAIGLASLQVAVLIGLSAIRGGAFHITGAGLAWFVGAALLFTVFMYGLAETLASRVLLSIGARDPASATKGTR